MSFNVEFVIPLFVQEVFQHPALIHHNLTLPPNKRISLSDSHDFEDLITELDNLYRARLFEYIQVITTERNKYLEKNRPKFQRNGRDLGAVVGGIFAGLIVAYVIPTPIRTNVWNLSVMVSYSSNYVVVPTVGTVCGAFIGHQVGGRRADNEPLKDDLINKFVHWINIKETQAASESSNLVITRINKLEESEEVDYNKILQLRSILEIFNQTITHPIKPPTFL